MADIRELREDFERANVRARGILEQHKDGVAGEARVEFDLLKKKMVDIKAQIAAEEKKADDEAFLTQSDDFLRQPDRKLPHGLNGDDGDLKALTDRGWEVKSGVAYAPTSKGEMVPMYPIEVLQGPIPQNDPAAAEFYKMTRAAFAPEYAPAYVKMVRGVARYGDLGMALGQLTPSEQKALSEGSDPAGGFLVPPDTQAEMLVRAAASSVMRRYARVQPTGRDVLKWPAVAPHASSGSIYSSGFVGGWVGETPAFTETDPVFQTFEIPIRKLRVATKLSNDFINDAQVNVLAFLAVNGGENIGLVEDNGFITGAGTPLEPTGLLESGIATVDVEGSTANTITNASGAGSSQKLVTLAYTLPAQYAGRAVWLMRRAIEGKVRALSDTSGRPLWPPMTGSGLAAAPPDLLGSPVANSDFIPTDGVDGAKVVVYGDLSNYIIAQRAQVTSIVLRERFADTDQVGFILFERVGGALWNTDAVRIGIV